MLQRETKEKSFQFYGLFRWDLSTNRSRLIFIRFRYSNVWIIEVKWARSREQNVNSICVRVTFLPNDRYRHISPSSSLSHTAPPCMRIKANKFRIFHKYSSSGLQWSIFSHFDSDKAHTFMELSQIFHVNLFLPLNIHVCIDECECVRVCVCAFHFRWNWPLFFKRNGLPRSSIEWPLCARECK